MIEELGAQIAESETQQQAAQAEVGRLTTVMGEALADGDDKAAKGIEGQIAKLRAALEFIPAKLEVLTRRREQAQTDLDLARWNADRAALDAMSAEGLTLHRQLVADIERILTTSRQLGELSSRSSSVAKRLDDAPRPWLGMNGWPREGVRDLANWREGVLRQLPTEE